MGTASVAPRLGGGGSGASAGPPGPRLQPRLLLSPGARPRDPGASVSCAQRDLGTLTAWGALAARACPEPRTWRPHPDGNLGAEPRGAATQKTGAGGRGRRATVSKVPPCGGLHTGDDPADNQDPLRTCHGWRSGPSWGSCSTDSPTRTRTQTGTRASATGRRSGSAERSASPAPSEARPAQRLPRGCRERPAPGGAVCSESGRLRWQERLDPRSARPPRRLGEGGGVAIPPGRSRVPKAPGLWKGGWRASNEVVEKSLDPGCRAAFQPHTGIEEPCDSPATPSQDSAAVGGSAPQRSSPGTRV